MVLSTLLEVPASDKQSTTSGNNSGTEALHLARLFTISTPGKPTSEMSNSVAEVLRLTQLLTTPGPGRVEVVVKPSSSAMVFSALPEVTESAKQATFSGSNWMTQQAAISGSG
jgi:hypothetical protein